MHIIRRAATIVAVAGLAVVGWAVPTTTVAGAASSATGYTVIQGDGVCDLATVDLTTGQLTDLPAASSAEACAVDLAVTPSGKVWGIWGNFFRSGSITPQAPVSAVLVSYAADGTATTVPITDPLSDGYIGLADGGIAVAPNGTVYVHLVNDNPGCDTGTTPDTTIAPLYAGDSVCLFTVNPATGVATIVGTTGLFETVFSQLAWCGGLISTADTSQNGSWVTESTSTGAVTVGPDIQEFPAGYDCDSTTGSPLYALVGDQILLDGASAPAATGAAVATVDPATGVTTPVAPLSDQAADVMALAVVPTAAPTPTTQPAAVAADTVVPAFTG